MKKTEAVFKGFLLSEFAHRRHGSKKIFWEGGSLGSCVVEMLTLHNLNSMWLIICKSFFCANPSIQGTVAGSITG